MLSSVFQNSRTKKLVSKMRQSRVKKKQLSKEGEVRREKIAVRTQQLQPDISELSNCGGELLWCCGAVVLRWVGLLTCAWRLALTTLKTILE